MDIIAAMAELSQLKCNHETLTARIRELETAVKAERNDMPVIEILPPWARPNDGQFEVRVYCAKDRRGKSQTWGDKSQDLQQLIEGALFHLSMAYPEFIPRFSVYDNGDNSDDGLGTPVVPVPPTPVVTGGAYLPNIEGAAPPIIPIARAADAVDLEPQYRDVNRVQREIAKQKEV